MLREGHPVDQGQASVWSMHGHGGIRACLNLNGAGSLLASCGRSPGVKVS